MIDKYGADALRFNIITGNSPGNDMRFYVERCEAMRNFANKIWNASRFVMMNLTIDKCGLPETLELEDKWILSRLNTLTREVGENLDKFDLGVAATKLYDFIWDNFCDWYIELTKTRLNAGDVRAQQVLLYVLTQLLKLLHPFMPYITEEIYQALPHEGEALIVETYPTFDEALAFPAEEEAFQSVISVIRAVRARRTEMNVPANRRPHLYIVTEKPEIFEAGKAYLAKLAYAGEVTVCASLEDTSGMASAITNDASLYMPMAELVDLEKEKARMEKELAKTRQELEKTEARLQNKAFTDKAPEKVVNAEREKVAKAKALIANLEEGLKTLGV